jgi:hypothetical protein
VTARNTVGSSLQSEEVAILAAKEPDAPISLLNNAAITTGYQVGLEWSDGAYNGGSAVIDYQVSFKTSVGTEYTIFQSNILPKAITVTGL